MTSEEILLNPYLEKAGIRGLEIDRGKWIIQLCRDTMVMFGYDVTFSKEQLCCGIKARYSGELAIVRDTARLKTEILMRGQDARCRSKAGWKESAAR